MKILTSIIGYVFVACIVIGFIWGGYWLTKTLSYNWWYKDMVRQTITEMVKENSLK